MSEGTPRQFVIIQERAAGNDSVGTEWLETATFSPDATLAEVWEWVTKHSKPDGRTMIRPDETTREQQF